MGALVLAIFATIELRLISAIIISVHGKFGQFVGKSITITLLFMGLSAVFANVLWSLDSCCCCGWCYRGHSYIRITDTVQLATNTFTDKGVLLAANIMRPIGEGTAFGWRSEYDSKGGWVKWAYENRPFVARQLVAGLLGLLLYAGATWVILWFVEEEGQAL